MARPRDPFICTLPLCLLGSMLALSPSAMSFAQDAAAPTTAPAPAADAPAPMPAPDNTAMAPVTPAAPAGTQNEGDAVFPQPSVYPISWELQFSHGTPTRIVVDVPSVSPVPQAYWYLAYTVTNNTDKEQLFLPTFEMLTESGKLYLSNQNIPGRVFQAIKTREHSAALEPMTSIAGTLRIGPAEARDGVAIWPEPAGRLGHFSIFATGLSGEAQILKLVNGQYQRVTAAEQMKDRSALTILRKTLQMKYSVSGDSADANPVNADGEEWIMR